MPSAALGRRNQELNFYFSRKPDKDWSPVPPYQCSRLRPFLQRDDIHGLAEGQHQIVDMTAGYVEAFDASTEYVEEFSVRRIQ